MSDSHLRALERRWQETGSEEDEVAYLRERVRVGQLEQGGVELAAYCGHSASILFAGKPGLEENKSLEVFLRAYPWSKEAHVRAAMAAVQMVEAVWSVAYPDDHRPQFANQAVIRWILYTSKTHLGVDANINAQVNHAWDAASTADPAEAAYYVAVAAAEVAETANARLTGLIMHHARRSVEASLIAFERSRGDTGSAELIVRESISAAIIPWALGYSDPLFDSSEEENNPPSD